MTFRAHDDFALLVSQKVGFDRHMQKTVSVDFDGVLSDFRGWRGEKELDPPLPGAIEWLSTLVKSGHIVIIHTFRNPELIDSWLKG